MTDKMAKFDGNDPFQIFKSWLAEAEKTEPNDPNAIALASVDNDGLPNVRMVLLKDIDQDSFVFYTNYGSAKGKELTSHPAAAFVLHWKSLRRQIRVRGHITKEEGPQADKYYSSRSPLSRLGAWASEQSQPLDSRETLMRRVDAVREEFGETAKRPPFWGGFRLTPVEIEFWADGDARLHDRFRWTRTTDQDQWQVVRLNP